VANVSAPEARLDIRSALRNPQQVAPNLREAFHFFASRPGLEPGTYGLWTHTMRWDTTALEAAARKERAWTQFYKQPPQCDGNPTDAAMTECANHYIRARRHFEEAYAAGKL
jgi:hypothetical protein